jgi:hypothetical protein
MPKSESQVPTQAEMGQFSIRAYRGIEVGLGQEDPMADVSAQLEQKHPGHLVLVQVGRFLHGYDRTAHALNTLKNYQLRLVNTSDAPHIRVGFPAGNFKKRLWSMVEEFQIPYVVYLGSRAEGYTLYVSDQAGANASVLNAVSDKIVQQVIADLRARGEVNQTATKQLLANPDSAGFKLKTQAQDLDTQLLHDIIKMPRDLRVTFGENVRACMARVMGNVYAYGTAADRRAVLHAISADIDLLKHYLTQAPRLSKLKLAFDHRAGLAVELGRLVGGLLRAGKAAS